MGTLLTGLPAAFLDFVNWTHDSDILQLGHCGVGIPCVIDMIKTQDGRLKMLVFTRESDPETARGILYSGADVRVKNYEKLFHLKREHGFSHHLAVAMGDISKELKELCVFYGIEYISPDK